MLFYISVDFPSKKRGVKPFGGFSLVLMGSMALGEKLKRRRMGLDNQSSKSRMSR